MPEPDAPHPRRGPRLGFRRRDSAHSQGGYPLGAFLVACLLSIGVGFGIGYVVGSGNRPEQVAVIEPVKQRTMDDMDAGELALLIDQTLVPQQKGVLVLSSWNELYRAIRKSDWFLAAATYDAAVRCMDGATPDYKAAVYILGRKLGK